MGTIESTALKFLREKICAHRSELTSAFAQYDPEGTGNATSLSSCHHGQKSSHPCGEAEGTNPTERGPACQWEAGGQQSLAALMFFLSTEEA